MFNEVHLIGVGLINGSLSLDMRRLNLANKIVGIGRNKDRLIKAKKANVIDSFQLLDSVNISSADVVIIGVPVSKFKNVFETIKPTLNQDTLVTDVGSTKQNIINQAYDIFNQIPPNFVPGHPIAGSEQSGFEFAVEGLFKNRKVILTPTDSTSEIAVNKIHKMWQSVGADVDLMDASTHDGVVSATSHLPHMVAYTLVNYLSERKDLNSIFKYAAGGFYDFTRIASSDPIMWADICLANKDKLIESINGFTSCLNELLRAIETQDKKTIHELLKQAKATRDVNLPIK